MNTQGKIGIAVLGILLIVGVLAATSVVAPPPAKQCNDGLDNDGDGNTDYPADPGCSSKKDDNEHNCGDGICGGGETAATCAADCQICGNNVREGTETCDGTDLSGQTCQGLGFSGGTLGCQSSCGGYETSGCYTNTCADTDEGFNAFWQGSVVGSASGVPYNNTDSCSGTNLTEWHCAGTAPTSTLVDCNFGGNGTGCFNGACVGG